MRSSSWLYQYSAQSKFTYGLCPSGQNPAQLSLNSSNPYTIQDYPSRSVSLLPHETDESSPSYSSHDETQHQHHHSQHHHHHHHQRCDGSRESVDYAAGNGSKIVRQSHDEVEPVDMSINSTEHENSRNLYQLTHPMSYSPKHHHHHHHQQHQHHPQQQQQHHHDQQHQNKGNISPLPHYRGKTSIIQYTHGVQYNTPESPAKYNIIDLDGGYGGTGETCTESRTMTTVHSAQKRNHHHHHHHNQQQMNIKQQSSTISLMEGNETIEHHWSSSSPPVWSDTLQRVPDVVHQDLSPYITTPTTPVGTPDSELHSEVPVFNFEWSTGEQHVPVSKVIVCRNNSTGEHQQETRKSVQLQQSSPQNTPMTLQLPKRKNHTDAGKDCEK